MSAFVCVRTPDRVSWFEDEQHYYHEDPAVVLNLDPVQHLWWGRSYRPTPQAMTPSVGQVFRLLANFPAADVSEFVTHVVPEPGAPLEPVPVRRVPA
jgi:hypothetical protein